jgi:ribosomal protein S18 acetylase RimI-like enzyme
MNPAHPSPVTPTPLHFRFAAEADVTAVVTLVQSAFRGEASRTGWTTEADLLNGQRTDAGKVTEAIASAGCRILLAEQSGALVASAVLADMGDSTYLGMLAVQPGRQGTGIGRLMLAEAERLAHEAFAAPAIRITVIAQRRELIDWYERRGYQQTGECEPFPYGDVRSGLPRRDDLYFVILTKMLGPVYFAASDVTPSRSTAGSARPKR